MRSLLLGLLAFAGVARAGTLVLPVNVQTDLPSCEGTVETNRNGNQINIVFRKVKFCSNFDIVSTGFGILDAGYKAKKIPETSTGLRGGSFTIPQAYIDRGLNIITVEVRSNKGAHSDTIKLVFATNPVQPIVPVIPQPVHGTLRGFCADHDYSNFKAAKAFAYSGSGLGKFDSEATAWASEYNRTHRCNTIGEYKARFTALFDYGYNGSYLGKFTSEARTFALGYVETTEVPTVEAWKALFSVVQPFFYDGKYLGLFTSSARQRTDEWVRRGTCGNARLIAAIKSEFTRHFNFASSSAGLNQFTTQARAYAAAKVRNMTSCSDLIH